MVIFYRYNINPHIKVERAVKPELTVNLQDYAMEDKKKDSIVTPHMEIFTTRRVETDSTENPLKLSSQIFCL